jgi:hypothetical protein
VTTYVSNPIIQSGIMEKTTGIGLSLYNYVTNGKFSDIVINWTTTNGFKIDGTGCTGNVIDSCKFLNIGSYGGEVLTANNPGNTIRNSEFVEQKDLHIQSSYTTIENCNITSNNAGSGVGVILIESANYNKVVGCTIDCQNTANLAGVYLNTGTDNWFSGNRIYNIAYRAFAVAQHANNTIISGNYISGGNPAIRINAVSFNWEISNNYFTGCTVAINLQANANYGVIKGNTFLSCATILQDSATGTGANSNWNCTKTSGSWMAETP